jgi:hypothetical protein
MLGNLVYQHVFRPLCFRLAPLAENATAWQSVAHLTITNPFWRSVLTFLVLWHTEAGGTPAFQSAPLRGCCRLRRRLAFWFYRCVFRSRCRRAIMIYRRRNRPAVGCPPYRLSTLLVVYLTGCPPYRLTALPVVYLTGCLLFKRRRR